MKFMFLHYTNLDWKIWQCNDYLITIRHKYLLFDCHMLFSLLFLLECLRSPDLRLSSIHYPKFIKFILMLLTSRNRSIMALLRHTIRQSELDIHLLSCHHFQLEAYLGRSMNQVQRKSHYPSVDQVFSQMSPIYPQYHRLFSMNFLHIVTKRKHLYRHHRKLKRILVDLFCSKLLPFVNVSLLLVMVLHSSCHIWENRLPIMRMFEHQCLKNRNFQGVFHMSKILSRYRVQTWVPFHEYIFLMRPYLI